MFIKATELKKNIIDDDLTQKDFNKDNEESIINNEFMLFRSYWRKSIFDTRKDRKIQRNFKIASKNLKRANNIFKKENQKLEEENIHNGIQNDPIIMHQKTYQMIFCMLKYQNDIYHVFGKMHYIKSYNKVHLLYYNIINYIIIFYDWLHHDEFKNDDDNKKKLQQMINLLLNGYEFSIYYWFKNEKYADFTNKNNIKELLKDFSRDKIYTQKKNETHEEFISYIIKNKFMFYKLLDSSSVYYNLSKFETINSRQKINNVIRDMTTLLHSFFTNKHLDTIRVAEHKIFNVLKSDHKNAVECSNIFILFHLMLYKTCIDSWGGETTISIKKTHMDIMLQDLLQGVLSLSDMEKNDIFKIMLSFIPGLISNINKELQDKFPSFDKLDNYNLSLNLDIYKKSYNPTIPIYHDSIYISNDLQKLVDMDCHNLDKLVKLIPSSKFLYDIKTNTTYLQLDKELLRQHFILEKLYHKLAYNIFKYYVFKLRQYYFTANKDDSIQYLETIKEMENKDIHVLRVKQYETLYKNKKVLISFDVFKRIYDPNGVKKSEEELNFPDKKLNFQYIYQMLSTL